MSGPLFVLTIAALIFGVIFSIYLILIIRNRNVNNSVIKKVGIGMLIYAFLAFPPGYTIAILLTVLGCKGKSSVCFLILLCPVAVCLIYIIGSIGIIKIKNWGRVMAIYTAGLALLLGLYVFGREISYNFAELIKSFSLMSCFNLFFLFLVTLPFLFLFLFLMHSKTKKQFIKNVV